jgi:hypothetical protein
MDQTAKFRHSYVLHLPDQEFPIFLRRQWLSRNNSGILFPYLTHMSKFLFSTYATRAQDIAHEAENMT